MQLLHSRYPITIRDERWTALSDGMCTRRVRVPRSDPRQSECVCVCVWYLSKPSFSPRTSPFIHRYPNQAYLFIVWWKRYMYCCDEANNEGGVPVKPCIYVISRIECISVATGS